MPYLLHSIKDTHHWYQHRVNTGQQTHTAGASSAVRQGPGPSPAVGSNQHCWKCFGGECPAPACGRVAVGDAGQQGTSSNSCDSACHHCLLSSIQILATLHCPVFIFPYSHTRVCASCCCVSRMPSPAHTQAATNALQQQPPPPEGTLLPCAAAPMHCLRLKKLGGHHITALALSPDGKVCLKVSISYACPCTAVVGVFLRGGGCISPGWWMRVFGVWGLLPIVWHH